MHSSYEELSNGGMFGLDVPSSLRSSNVSLPSIEICDIGEVISSVSSVKWGKSRLEDDRINFP